LDLHNGYCLLVNLERIELSTKEPKHLSEAPGEELILVGIKFILI